MLQKRSLTPHQHATKLQHSAPVGTATTDNPHDESPVAVVHTGRQFAVRDLITADVKHQASHIKYFKTLTRNCVWRIIIFPRILLPFDSCLFKVLTVWFVDENTTFLQMLILVFRNSYVLRPNFESRLWLCSFQGSLDEILVQYPVSAWAPPPCPLPKLRSLPPYLSSDVNPPAQTWNRVCVRWEYMNCRPSCVKR